MRLEHGRLIARLRRHVHFGTTPSVKDVFIPLDEFKRTSTHVVGAAGYGKSYVLRNVIRHCIRFNQPFWLMEPHRELIQFALATLRRSSVPRHKVVLIDPGDPSYSAGFNPLSCGIDDPGEAASLVLQSVLAVWGAESFDQTPRLEGLLRGTFRLLAENQLTLVESMAVLDVDNRALRQTLCERVSDPWVRQDFEEFEKWPRADKIAVLESSRNRLRRVLQSAPVRRMLGQQRQAIDVQALLDNGDFVLMDVGNTPAPETTQLLGKLFINAVHHAAKRRNPVRRRDVFLIIDEAGQFATADIASSLDQLRKFGVHLILAHQRLRQMERENGDLLSALLTNAKLRIVLGGLERVEAMRLAQELFTGAVDGDEIKHVAYQTKFRPVDSTFEIETESWSNSESGSDSSSESSSDSSGKSLSEATSYKADGITLASVDDIIGLTRTSGLSNFSARGNSSGRTSSHASASGGSRSVVPATLHDEFIEETGRTFYSLDEQWERRIALIHGLSKREAFVKLHNSTPIRFYTADVPAFKDERQTDRFRTDVLSKNPHVQATAAVEREIEARRRALAERVDLADERGRPLDIKSFRE